ncbi:MAG TPA: hypothetical protein VKX29_02460 [Brumimicrobium sp.]|nr:hypothetical protein [Brumimicrobium sp.]
MSTIKDPVTISNNVSSKNDLDFEYLKELGILYIESMGGDLWTDYNEHDPGITILEILSYAITDLGNRINIPMKDLLVTKDNPNLSHQFYKASEILPSKSVTALDYRKLFIDLDGVRNCWIQPYEREVYANCKEGLLSYNPDAFSSLPPELKTDFKLKGLNKIIVDFDIDENLDPAQRAALINQISDSIKVKFHNNRNLCEDLVEVKEVEQQCVCVCAEIELRNTADEDEVHAHILYAIHKYFSPVVRFYSLKEMMDKGYRTDQVFEGPFLENGFIDTTELIEADLRSEVRLSDLMQLISKIDGVKIIKDITISDCDNKEPGNNWIICLDPGKKPVLCDGSQFSYKKDVVPVSYDPATVQEYYDELVEEEDAKNENAKNNRHLSIPKGEYLETDFYTTIQNDFPDTYGIGQDGLPSSVPVERKAKSKQLKAYLLFFDQVLGSYFAHLGKVGELLSVDNKLKNTYFTQAVKDLKGIDDLVENYPMNNNHQLTEHLMKDLDNSTERRNELLNHLLARFAENFSEYSFLMKELYGSVASEMVLRSKQVFLKEYVELSSHRGEGFNYYHQQESNLWDTGNVSGAQKRIARLSGMKDYFRRNLCTNIVEIYEYIPKPGELEYKWRIRNYSGDTILSSVRTHLQFKNASEEVYKSILKVIETSEDKIKEAFESGVVDGQIVENIQIKISGGGNYYFQVVDPSILDPIEQVLGRQFTYYSTSEELEIAILEIIEFMTFEFTEEGIYLVEHIILRPDVFDNDAPEEQFLTICKDDCDDICSLDPYSFKVSVVLPGFTRRFYNKDFRVFMEELIQRELPAHVLAKICWIGYRKNAVPDIENELLQFQKTYKDYLFAKTDLEQEQDEPTLLAFKEVLTDLNTIYPTGILEDCEGGETGNKIILGRTKIGTL